MNPVCETVLYTVPAPNVGSFVRMWQPLHVALGNVLAIVAKPIPLVGFTVTLLPMVLVPEPLSTVSVTKYVPVDLTVIPMVGEAPLEVFAKQLLEIEAAKLAFGIETHQL